LGQEKAMLQMKGYPKPVFYIKLLMDRLLQAQWAGQVSERTQAENFIRNQAKQIRNIWMQQRKEAALKTSVKQAALKQVVAQHLGQDNGTAYLEGDPRGAKEQGYQTLNRGVQINFNVGDTVRQRNRGLNFKQKQGTVEKIQNNIMRIKWEDGKTSNYSMLDSGKIFSELEKDV